MVINNDKYIVKARCTNCNFCYVFSIKKGHEANYSLSSIKCLKCECCKIKTDFTVTKEEINQTKKEYAAK